MDVAERIERQGFAVVPDVLGPGEVAALVGALDRVAGGQGLRRQGSLYGLRDLLRLVPEVRRLAGSDAVLDLVRPVLGDGAAVVRGLLFDKTPEANWNVPWHRDLTIAVEGRREAPGFGPWTVKAGIPHVRPPLDVLRRMLTVRLHLDDCGSDNGPLCVIPGSHALAGLGDAADRSLRARVPAVACPVGAGGALLMRPLLLHASSGSERPGHRRVLHLEFAADPLPCGLRWHEACA